MRPKPVIFISAVSKELHGAREIVVRTLEFLGYEYDYQPNFDLEHGKLTQMLEKRISKCDAVIHLVGKAYGTPYSSDQPPYGSLSYTQFEAIFATQLKKEVYYLLIEDSYPSAPFDPEDLTDAELQKRYRDRLIPGGLLVHKIPCECQLERHVLRLRVKFARFWEKPLIIGPLAVSAMLIAFWWIVHHEITPLRGPASQPLDPVKVELANIAGATQRELSGSPKERESPVATTRDKETRPPK